MTEEQKGAVAAEIRHLFLGNLLPKVKRIDDRYEKWNLSTVANASDNKEIFDTYEKEHSPITIGMVSHIASQNHHPHFNLSMIDQYS